MGETTTWIGFGTRGAESQIQVCCRRVVAQLAKNAENSPSAHHISLQSLCCEMCQWNNDLLRWWCMIKPNNWYSNYIQAPCLGYKAWKRPFVLRSSWEKLRFNNHVPIFWAHLRLCIACFHLQLNFPSQSAHTIEFVDRIRRAGKDGPSHHDKRDHHHSNFLLNAVAGHRKPGEKSYMDLHGRICSKHGNHGAPQPEKHPSSICFHDRLTIFACFPGATTRAAKPTAHGYPTPWQLES